LRAFSSVFQQILNLFPQAEFAALVKTHAAERHARGFTCWQQFVSMLFCQLGRAQSLREICDGLASTEGKLVHLGLRSAPRRSTLSYANEHRPWQLYRDVFNRLYARCKTIAPKHKLRFKNTLLSIDATTIDLCASIFDWAKFRRAKGGVKLHLVLDHDGYLPAFAVITEAKKYDVKVAKGLVFPAGAVVVFDRAYNDFQWFYRLSREGVFFVTRMKDRTRYLVLEDRPLPSRGRVIRDQVIELVKTFEGVRPVKLRRIEFLDDQGEILVFVTNHMDFAASTIAAIFKERWQIELMFKALKQGLRIKTFVGTSANALHIQIWTALIAMLVLKYLKMKARFGWSLSNLIALLRFNLFAYRDLWAWLDDPFPPSKQLHEGQLRLPQLGQQNRQPVFGTAR
jgi:hypothetical protein